jgi:hypothetical protein
MMIHAIDKWDIVRSCEIGKALRLLDDDLAKPGWCWNSAMAATMLLDQWGEEGVVYVEGWLHNHHPRAPHPKYPHGWTVLGDGTVIDTCSGAIEPSPGAMAMSCHVWYESVHEWDAVELEEILNGDPMPPLTPEYDNWGGTRDAEAVCDVRR